MKISELIKELKEIKKKHGNLEVKAGYFPISHSDIKIRIYVNDEEPKFVNIE